MMCKDCIHYDICVFHADGNKADKCRNFKNKADVVEVVRCKDCKYKDDCVGRMAHVTRDYVLEMNETTYNKVVFCSYGERKEGET